MISAVSTNSPYSTYGAYGASYANRARTQGADQAQSAQRSLVMTARKAPQPETPVQPVAPVRAVSSQEDPVQAGLQRYNADASEVAVRMRIQQPGDTAQQGNAAQAAGLEKAQAPGLPSAKGDAIQQAEDSAVKDAKSAREVMEEGECQTCKERKYQDGSDDPGVSFKTPTHISPDQAASAVRGHEMEHVYREQAKADREGRKVVSQSVTMHTEICPECGKAFVSGGTTRTVTKADTGNAAQQDAARQNEEKQKTRLPFSAVA